MPANDPLSVAYATLKSELTSYSPLWNARVYADEDVPSNVSHPYITYFLAAGGEANVLPHNDAILVLTVKCVANTLAEALDGAAALSAALNNRGQVENTSNPVSVAGSNWRIINITQERRVHGVVKFSDVASVVESGHQFRIFMEAIT